MRFAYYVTIFAIAFLLGCLQNSTPHQPPISDVIDRTPDHELDATCEAVCANLRSIGCPEGYGSLGGVSCTQVCINRALRGPTPLACWRAATTTSDAQGCGQLRCVNAK